MNDRLVMDAKSITCGPLTIDREHGLRLLDDHGNVLVSMGYPSVDVRPTWKSRDYGFLPGATANPPRCRYCGRPYRPDDGHLDCVSCGAYREDA